MKLNIGGITEAGVSKHKNFTGSWRFFAPVIDEEKCNGCGICELFCPESCITIEDVARPDSRFCKGCGICSKECIKSAIKMEEEGDKQ